MQATAQAVVAVDGTIALAAEREQLIQEFENELREHPDIDRASADFLTNEFRTALMMADINPALTPPDTASSKQTLELLAANGLLSEDELHLLTRQFEAMISPTQDAGLQNALEFARRAEQDGQEKALAWLAAQEQADSEQQIADSNSRSDIPPALGQSITASRSRRLRGPPRKT